MLLYIDPREGSNKLLKEFEGECCEFTLDGGDVAFWGKGPEDAEWFVGIEYKQVADVVECIKSGRFTGEQLPKMLKMYDICFLLIEGNYQPDYAGYYGNSPRLVVPYRGNNGIRFGMNYRAFDNFLTSINLCSIIAGKPCIVKRSNNKRETVEIIRDLYAYFQKTWEEHTAINTADKTKQQRIPYIMEVLKVEPGHEDYPKAILRKSLFQIDGFGWDLAGIVADHFGTLENVMLASQKDWEVKHDSKRGVGTVLAARAYMAFHGHEDTEVAARRHKRKVNKNG